MFFKSCIVLRDSGDSWEPETLSGCPRGRRGRRGVKVTVNPETVIVIPSEGDLPTQDAQDRKVEATLWRDFEASLAAVRASLATTCFPRAIVVWLEYLKSLDRKDHPDYLSIFKRISLAFTSVGNACMNIMWLAAQTMTSNLVARCQIYLCPWVAETTSVNPEDLKVPMHSPFVGEIGWDSWRQCI